MKEFMDYLQGKESAYGGDEYNTNYSRAVTFNYIMGVEVCKGNMIYVVTRATDRLKKKTHVRAHNRQTKPLGYKPLHILNPISCVLWLSFNNSLSCFCMSPTAAS
jgi:hypothetical protein